ncbi:DUF4190 domain-containing protein [Streptomyces sp. NPDC017993]|uniref:DUF4190 domain-containing protein n=1 Tax=Streptomyces sp. NPDC017993 TaxID=3365027 RepID=UPI00378A446D
MADSRQSEPGDPWAPPTDRGPLANEAEPSVDWAAPQAAQTVQAASAPAFPSSMGGYGERTQGAPAYGVPAHAAPADGAPAYGAPDYGTSAYGGPAYGAPAAGHGGQDVYGGQWGQGGAVGPSGYAAHPSYAAYPSVMGYSTWQPARPSNGFGTAALVVGIVGVLLGISIIFGIVLGVLAIVFGALGRAKATRGEATNGGMALAGLILGGIALLISAVVITLAMIGASHPQDERRGGSGGQDGGYSDTYEAAPRAPEASAV